MNKTRCKSSGDARRRYKPSLQLVLIGAGLVGCRNVCGLGVTQAVGRVGRRARLRRQTNTFKAAISFRCRCCRRYATTLHQMDARLARLEVASPSRCKRNGRLADAVAERQTPRSAITH